MTKSEKLILVLRLLKEKPGLQISDIAEYCGISQRTAYRYVQTLIQMRQPVRYNGGYRLEAEHELPAASLLPDDLALIQIAFASSPLTQSKQLQNRFLSMTAALNSNNGYNGRLKSAIDIVGSGANLSDCRSLNLLPILIEAVLDKRTILIELGDDHSNGSICIKPLRLIFHGEQYTLTGEISESGEATVIESDNISKVRLAK